MLPRTQLIRIQRSLYDRLRSQAKGLYGGMPEGLKKYYTEYQKDFTRFKGFATKSQLLEDLNRSQIVFCGDYHTLSQAQKTAVRLLREVERPIVIALEMLRSEDDAVVNSFLSAKLTETAFLKRIGFRKNWGFHWESYRRLFEFARTNRAKVVGLSPHAQAPLEFRDRFAARKVAELSLANPDALVFVLMGDLHLAQKHLPNQVKKALEKKKTKRNLLTIHQNYDPYYWELVNIGMEEFIEVIHIDEGRYCVLNTPPWVKLQSHISWLDCDYEVDYTDEFDEILGYLIRFLELKIDRPSNFEVCPPSASLANRYHLARDFSAKEMSALQILSANFKSLFVPRRNLSLIGTPSLNQLSGQAGIFLHSQLSGFSRVFVNPEKDFYSFVWVEALGFLSSKIINLRRKCGPMKALPKDWTLVTAYQAVKAQGQNLGQEIYAGLIHHKVKHAEVTALFHNEFAPKHARELYEQWSKRLDDAGLSEIAKSERL